MTLLAWVVCSVTATVGVGLAAVTLSGTRRHVGLLVMVAAVAGLLLTLDADLFAALWLLLVLPLCAVSPASSQDDALLRAAGPRLAAGVLAGVLWGALAYLGQRVDWYALPAGGFEAQSALLAGRLLSSDLVLVLGLLLTALAVVAGGLRSPVAADDHPVHAQRQGGTR